MKGGRRLLLVLGLAALLVPLVGTGVARADPAPTKVQISENAEYANPGQINLQITLSCTPGYGDYV